MEDVVGKIQAFHNLFLVCLVLAVLCLALAVILFFVLDIKSVIGYLTGRRAKKQIQALEESSAASGRLMSRERSNMQYMAQEIKEDMGVRGTVTPGARKVENAVSNDQTAKTEQGGDELTSLLRDDNGGQETSLLSQRPQEMAEVHQTGENNKPAKVLADGSTAVLEDINVPIGTFNIEKEIILIHAEEVI